VKPIGNYYFDKAYGNWQPVEPVEIIGGKCKRCGESLIVGEEYVRDSKDGEEFCNNECFLNEYAQKFILEVKEDGRENNDD
jgi:hypothetical protein